MEKQEEKVYINGRKQVVDLFHHMDLSAKKRLLQLIQQKNPTLASELTVESFSFRDLKNLSIEKIRTLLRYCSAPVIGFALKSLQQQEQKNWLAAIDDRDKAVESFRYLKHSAKPQEIDKACLKMVFIAKELSESGKIRF